jgi:hypothetical protein
MQDVGCSEEFSCIDISLHCYDGNEDCEEASVEQTAATHQKTSEDREADEDDKTKRERMTNHGMYSVHAGRP